MLLTLLACAGGAIETGVPTEVPETPVWEGTQIGEEGDTGCPMELSAWSDEDTAPDGSAYTPAEFRSLAGGSFSGVLQSAWQGEASLTATFTLDGDAWALTPKLEDCAAGMAVEGTLSLSAEELLDLQAPVTLTVTQTADFSALIAESDLTGDLDPGVLPDDAISLSLLILGTLDGDWSGELRWQLYRESAVEEAPAGTWSAAR